MAKNENGGGGDLGCLAVILGLVLWVGFDKLDDRMASLEETLVEQRAPPAGEAELRAELGRLRIENADLRARVEALEAR